MASIINGTAIVRNADGTVVETVAIKDGKFDHSVLVVEGQSIEFDGEVAFDIDNPHHIDVSADSLTITPGEAP